MTKKKAVSGECPTPVHLAAGKSRTELRHCFGFRFVLKRLWLFSGAILARHES
jgi:hypothetical protein